jgi:hypothetical protein
MNGHANNAPKSSLLKAAGLWAKSSVKDGQFLTGRLGGMKVLILENRDRQKDDDPSHYLFFAEAAPRQDRAEPRPGQPSLFQPNSRPPGEKVLKIRCRCTWLNFNWDYRLPIFVGQIEPANDMI